MPGMTISVRCDRCGYTRYDLMHLSDGCGGLLVRDCSAQVHCRLCGEDMSGDAQVTCPACGLKRVMDLSGTPTSVVSMGDFNTAFIA